MSLRRRTLLLIFATSLAACAGPRDQQGGDGLAAAFERALARRVDHVMRHLIADRVYYYVASPCCDLFNPLFDAQGKYVCAPDGGFAGRGDGRCPADLRVDSSAGEPVPNPFYER